MESADSIRLDTNMVTAINEMSTPGNKAALRTHFSMITYFSKFIDNFSNKTLPLRQLLKTDFLRTLSASLRNAFDSLKRNITTMLILCYFDHYKPVFIQTDASSTVIGSVLLQNEQPLSHASCTIRM